MTTRKINKGSSDSPTDEHTKSSTTSRTASTEKPGRAPKGPTGPRAPLASKPTATHADSEPLQSPALSTNGVAFEDVTSGAFDDLGGSDDSVFADDDLVLESPHADEPSKRVLLPQSESPKLHKVLAQSGLGSRLEMEAMITQGRVTVNNQPAHVGQRIQQGDVVKVNGHVVHWRVAAPQAKVIAYHKPVGEIVTTDDPQNRPTVFRKLPRLYTGKWQSVGRLDINTEGLLLFTNSGELANKLMHPRFGLEREYAVRVLGALKKEEKERLLEGVNLDDGPASFGSIEDGGGEGANCWYRVTIQEGRNREVRRLFESVGHAVSRLIRIRYGAMALPKGLQRGHWMELGEPDVQALMNLVGHETHQQPVKRGKRISSPKSGPRAKSPEAAMIKLAKTTSRSRRGAPSYVNPRELTVKDDKTHQNTEKPIKTVTIGADSYSKLRKDAKGRRRANVSSGGFTGAGKGADGFVSKPGSKKPGGRGRP